MTNANVWTGRTRIEIPGECDHAFARQDQKTRLARQRGNLYTQEDMCDQRSLSSCFNPHLPRTLSISSVGEASFLSDSSSLMAFSGGSFAATHFVSALTREASSRSSMDGMVQYNECARARDDKIQQRKRKKATGEIYRGWGEVAHHIWGWGGLSQTHARSVMIGT